MVCDGCCSRSKPASGNPRLANRRTDEKNQHQQIGSVSTLGSVGIITGGRGVLCMIRRCETLVGLLLNTSITIHWL